MENNIPETFLFPNTLPKSRTASEDELFPTNSIHSISTTSINSNNNNNNNINSNISSSSSGSNNNSSSSDSSYNNSQLSLNSPNKSTVLQTQISAEKNSSTNITKSTEKLDELQPTNSNPSEIRKRDIALDFLTNNLIGHTGRLNISKQQNEKQNISVEGTFLYKAKDDTVEYNSPAVVSPKKPCSISKFTYGVELCEVEKDEQHTNVPKFVIECIKVIEEDENIKTNGIYRASGKKDSIEKVKKKINEFKGGSKSKKFTFLKNEDVHTITGALKQFFRELKSELIPLDIVVNLPNDLENKENLVKIKNAIDKLDIIPKSTLEFLLKHLIKVDSYSKDNLMNSSNLSIVWGACIFTNSVAAANAFDTTDLMKKNALIRILIENFNQIF